MNLIWITSAKYLDGYCLQLTFNNGEVKIFDGKDIVANNPLFFPLRTIAVFKDFVLDGWTVSWQNGKLDLAPDYLNNRRLAYAQQLMLTTQMKMVQVAEESGFAGTSHMNRLFRQQFDCTPTAWLKEQRDSLRTP